MARGYIIIRHFAKKKLGKNVKDGLKRRESVLLQKGLLIDLLKLKLFDVSPQRQMFGAKSLNLLKCSRVRGPRGEAVVN